MRATHSMAYFDLSKLNLAKANVLKAFVSNCNGNRRDKVALKTPTTEMSNSKYQNEDKLSCRILLLQWKPKLCRTKPSSGRGLDIAALDEAGHGKKQDENKQTAKHRNKKGDSTWKTAQQWCAAHIYKIRLCLDPDAQHRTHVSSKWCWMPWQLRSLPE